MKTPKLLLISLAAVAVAFAGCKKYDDTDLRNKVENHEERITDLESAVSQLEAQIKAGALISGVTKTEDGWKIAFTGGTTSSIDIFHGEGGQVGTPAVAPVLEVRRNSDGSATLWVNYGDGWEDTKVDLTGPQGTPGSGSPGADGVTPKIDVRVNGDGTRTIWYNVTAGYPDNGWVNTKVDLTGNDGAPGSPVMGGITPMIDVRLNPDGTRTVWYNAVEGYPNTGWVNTYVDLTGGTGTPGEDAVTPKFKVVVADGKSILWYNVTLLENGEYDDENGWVSTEVDLTGPQGGRGDKGDKGDAGITPGIKVVTDETGTYIYYNVTVLEGGGYDDTKWIKTGVDLSATGPVKAIVNNVDGTYTIVLNDGDDTEYVFEKASTAVRFEIMTYDLVSIVEGGAGTIRFVVNPSTAWIPTTGDGGTGKWYLNGVGTRAPGYVQPSALSIVSILPSDNGQGEYIATVTGDYDEAVSEHIVSLVLNTGSTEAPVLVSSEPLAVAITQPVVTPVISITTQPAAETEVTEWIVPADTRLNVAATVTEGAALSYRWYVNSAPDVVGGTSIPGATGTSYSIPTDTEAGVYYYYAVVSATGGASPVTSDFAKVTVTADREHQDKGVVINGLTWATRNVGSAGTFVATPQDYGELFDFEDAQSTCPAGWRTPTLDELKTLYDSGSVWVTGTPNGRRFGPEGKNIFMPAAGWWDDALLFGGLKDRETLGSYWSSTSKDRGFLSGWAYYSMDFNRNGVDYDYGNGDQDHGMSLRCVKR